MDIKKINIKTWFLYGWVIFSVLFFVWFIANFFINSVYKKGMYNTVGQIVKEIEALNCSKTYPIAFEGKTLQLVDYTCIQQQQQSVGQTNLNQQLPQMPANMAGLSGAANMEEMNKQMIEMFKNMQNPQSQTGK